MKTSYKFWYVHKEDDVHINEVAVRFYEGEITTAKERKINDKMEDVLEDVTRYRMSKRLQKADLSYEKNRATKKESSGEDCLIFTDKDFGKTDNLDVVRDYLNGILAKDTKREPIAEQVKLIK